MNQQDINDIKISKKKLVYPVLPEFRGYLKRYNRIKHLPIEYHDLERSEDMYPILDKYGKDTLWCTVLYSQFDMEEIYQGLKEIYSMLKAGDSQVIAKFLTVECVDCCVFGNSKPYRVKIKNTINDNHDYFYIKKSDASRVYGLELEQLLSPNMINFLIHNDTLVEEHIVGIPGDVYLEKYNDEEQDLIRLGKEFVKFNERCFLRLLGDQRAYNFLVVQTPDFDKMQYRIRSIDFDQQCYEGNIRMYKPQYFKENIAFVRNVLDYLDETAIEQYRIEERALMAKRVIAEGVRISKLIEIMKKEPLSLQSKIDELKESLYQETRDKKFLDCQTMGDIMEIGIRYLLRNYKHVKY